MVGCILAGLPNVNICPLLQENKHALPAYCVTRDTLLLPLTSLLGHQIQSCNETNGLCSMTQGEFPVCRRWLGVRLMQEHFTAGETHGDFSFSMDSARSCKHAAMKLYPILGLVDAVCILIAGSEGLSTNLL